MGALFTKCKGISGKERWPLEPEFEGDLQGCCGSQRQGTKGRELLEIL